MTERRLAKASRSEKTGSRRKSGKAEKVKRGRKKYRGEESEGNTTYQSPARIIQLSHRNIVGVDVFVWFVCVCR